MKVMLNIGAETVFDEETDEMMETAFTIILEDDSGKHIECNFYPDRGEDIEGYPLPGKVTLTVYEDGGTLDGKTFLL